jgi:DNA polymerase III psi subunit
MIGGRQQAYLEAMGIPLWESRSAVSQQTPVIADVQGLKLGPGNGGILLICAADTESASRLSNDISRSLGSVPVWAWPDSNTTAISPADAVDENLFTTVAIFGRELAGQFFGRDMPSRLESASLVLLPAMKDLEQRAEARQELWQLLCRYGMVAAAGN